MKDLVITTDNKSETYAVKSKWDELTAKEFLKICWINSQYEKTENTIDTNAMRFSLFSIICSLPFKRYTEITASQWIDVFKLTDWLFKTPQLRSNPLPFFKINNLFGKKIIAGPVGLMSTSSFAEFMAVDDAFLDFHNRKNQDAAWQLLAILWRPQRSDILRHKKDARNWNNDYREEFNTSNIEQLALYYQRTIHPQYAIAALLYYESVRNQVLIKNKLLKSLYNSNSTTKTYKTTLSQTGWLSTLIEISGKKFGDFESTSRTNWLLVLVDLANEIEKSINNK